MAKAGLPVDSPFDPAGLMRKPGFKVLNAQDLDYRISVFGAVRGSGGEGEGGECPVQSGVGRPDALSNCCAGQPPAKIGRFAE